ncbi:MAG: 2TM domain-containing protein [Rhodothermales bacterium]
MTESEAKKQVRDEKEFYGHLASYLVFNTLFIGMSLFSGGYWFIFPLLGWGIGLVSHAARVFGLPGKGGDWERRRLQELLGQEETQASLDALRTQLRALERGEQVGTTETPDVARLLRRIENLEAIVTSRDWDLLDDEYRAPSLSLDEPAALDEPADGAAHTERIARRVR